MWSFVKAAIPHPGLFETVTNHVVARDNLQSFDPQAISVIMSSFVKAEVPHSRLFEKMANHVVALDNLQDFNEQDISNIVWAYAKADISLPDLYKKWQITLLNLTRCKTSTGRVYPTWFGAFQKLNRPSSSV